MRTQFVAKVVLLSTLFVPLTFAQTAPASDSGIPKFTSRSELVMVPVVVTDKSGQHVKGLKKEDFAVLQNGKSMPIAVFDEINTQDTALPPHQTPDGVFSNAVPTDNVSRRVMVIVMDLLNTPFADSADARRALFNNAKVLIDAHIPVSLMVINSTGLHEIFGLHSDPRILETALDRVGTPNPTDLHESATFGWDLGDKYLYNQYQETVAQLQNSIGGPGTKLGTSNPNPEAAYQSYRTHHDVEITLFSLEQLAHAYSGIPGRKIMIWITGGLPMNILDPTSISAYGDIMLDTYRRTFLVLNAANFSVYPVDAHGLGLESMSKHLNLTSTMNAFADATGGTAFYNRNDIGVGIRNAVQDAVQYYEIGYYLPHESHGKPQWEKIKVKVDRKETAVRTRDGFFSGYSEKPEPKSLKMEMELAFASPVAYTGFPIAIKVSALASGANLTFDLTVPPRSFRIDRENNNFANIEFAAVALGPHHQSSGIFARRITGNLTLENADHIESQGFAMHDTITLPANTNRVKFVIRDNLTGKIGSVVARLNTNSK
ncbi:hypothetical protein Acid345_2180 [Candidatus Koribacter versatilis Ellin345]|uniref:VWFA-related domain-containing protein n=1 Tax=Koribacter versatilis (strain Ellin345) TaxID=204669 RepID=Q1IPL9_KORVE|nr:VWA domain-containing protein [Candidatus Koribacter versatilis]ABF41181.1 hypothetical protein Acid345_2180 [Candidatus Koribacter versatilis Ellin345]